MMIYNLLIHPSKIELYLRTFSPDKKEFSDKKIFSKDLGFKFGPDVIEKGDHYGSFKKTLEEVLNTVKSDIKTLHLIIRPSFFQIRELKCSKKTSEMKDYVNWEINQIATDIPEHYTYGTFYDEKEEKLIIALVKKPVIDYFRELIPKITADDTQIKIGCHFVHNFSDEIFIPTETRLLRPFGTEILDSDESYITLAKDESAKKTSPAYLILLPAFLISVAVGLWYYAPELLTDHLKFWVPEAPEDIIVSTSSDGNIDQEIAISDSSDTALSGIDTLSSSDSLESEISEIRDTLLTVASDSIDDKNIAMIPSEETAVTEEKEDEPDIAETEEPEEMTEPETKEVPVEKEDPAQFWNYISRLASLNIDSLITEKNNISVYFNNAEEIGKLEDIVPEGTFEYNTDGNTVIINDESFVFDNYGDQSNYNNFIDIRNDFYLFSGDNTYEIESMKIFRDFSERLNKKKVGIKKLKLVKENNKIYFTADFD